MMTLVKSPRVQVVPAHDEDGREMADALVLQLQTPVGISPTVGTWMTISIELAQDRRGLAWAISRLREKARLQRQGPRSR